jgi:hemerythrin-like metal-binding protein
MEKLMILLKWSEELDTFVDEMNDEHKYLIDTMIDLETLFNKDPSSQEFKNMFYKLLDETMKHFKSEEMFMDEMNYSDISTHKTIHKKLLRTFKEHELVLLSEGRVNKSFFEFLNFWLKSHMSGVDTMYGRDYIKKSRAA